MTYRNYDLVMSDDGKMWLYLSCNWYWVNKPGSDESRARVSLPKGQYTQFGSLRDIAKDACVDTGVEKEVEEEDEMIRTWKSIRELLDESDVKPSKRVAGYRMVLDEE